MADILPGDRESPQVGCPCYGGKLRGDEAARKGWWPSWEDNLANLICAFLREHLTTQRPVINREVEIQPRNLEGGRTDVHVQAIDPRDTATQPLTLIIETKGCWNPEITTGISEQLLSYLSSKPGWAGIFLVGYFHHTGRLHENYRDRHRTTMKHTSNEILDDLRRQIAGAGASYIIRARVLQLPLIPRPASDSAVPQA